MALKYNEFAMATDGSAPPGPEQVCYLTESTDFSHALDFIIKPVFGLLSLLFVSQGSWLLLNQPQALAREM